jgi:hypothetical protein
MKNLLLKPTEKIIYMMTRVMIFLAAIGFFGTSAYSQIVAPSVTICGERSVTLNVTSVGSYTGGAVNWYTVPFYGTSIATGMSYVTPVLMQNTTYYVDYVVGGVGICDRKPVIVTISTTDIIASVFYSSGIYCNSLNEAQTPTITGSAGGTYSVSPTTPLVVNPVTGIFNPYNVNPGTYTITYHITNQNEGCYEEDCTAQIVINVPPSVPGISYTGSPWCSTATVQDVTQTGPDPELYPGTYSAAPSGLIIDANSGQITPAGSLPGTYEVTYLVGGLGGCAPQHGHTNVTITGLPTAEISYEGAPYCKSVASVQTPILTGTGAYTGGTYSYTGTSLSGFNSSTGAFLPSASTAGTYTIHYTIPASGNCATVTIDEEVKIFTLPTASITGTIAVCQLDAEPKITFTGLTGSAPFTFTFTVNSGGDQTVTTSTGSSVEVSQPTVSAGTYIYQLKRVTDNNGCTQAVSGEPTATITVNPTPVAEFSYVGSPFCKTGTTTPILAPGGTAGTFTSDPEGVVFNSGGEINLASTPAGTYEITNSITTCGEIHAHYTVTIISLPTPGISGTSPACGTTTLTATPGASSPTYVWYKNNVVIPDETTSTLVVTASDSYKVKVTDGTTGCENTSSAFPVVIVALPTASITGTLETCEDPTTLTAVSNAANPSYAWYVNSADTYVTTGTNSSTLSATVSGYYKVTITDGNTLCTKTSEPVLVTISTSDVPGTISGGQTVCTGENSTSLTLTGTKNNVVRWESSVAPFTSWTPITNLLGFYTATGLTETTHYRVLEQSGLCPTLYSAEGIVTVVPDPTIASQPAASTYECIGGTAQLSVTAANGTGAYSYQWYSNVENSNTGGTLIEGATASTYTPPTGSAGTIYYYVIVGAAGNGCNNITSNVAAVTTVADQPSWTSLSNPTPTALCLGGTVAFSVSVTGGTGGTISWIRSETSGGAGTTVTTGDAPAVGTWYYRPHYTPTCSGCSLEDGTETMVTVVADPSISLQPAATTSECIGGIVQLSVTAGNGTPSLTYQWYSNTSASVSGSTLLTGQTNSTYTPPTTGAGTTYYYVVVSAAGNGCTSITSDFAAVTVVADPSISVQPAATTAECIGGTVQLSVTAGNGTPSLTYQWYSNSSASEEGSTLLTGQTNPTYTPPTTGAGTTYYYVVVSAAGNGCTSARSDFATVTVVADPSISVQPAATTAECIGGTVQLSVTADNGTPSLTYQWYSNTSASEEGSTLLEGKTNPTYTPLTTAAGTTYYYVVVSAAGNGCTSVTSGFAAVTVVADPSISVQPAATTAECIGGTVQLSVTAGNGTPSLTYQWYSNTSASEEGSTLLTDEINTTYTPLTTDPGTTYYYVVVSAAGNGCTSARSDFAAVTVVADPSISVQPAATTAECIGGTAQLSVTADNGTPSLTYQWYSHEHNLNSGGVLIEGATASTYTPPSASAGTVYYYVIVGATGNGCTSVTSDVAAVTVDQTTVAGTVSSNQTICAGTQPASLTLSGSVGSVTKWQKAPDAAFTSPTDIAVTSTTLPGATIGNISANTYFRAVVKSGSCNTEYSTFVLINVGPITTVPTFTACPGNLIEVPVTVSSFHDVSSISLKLVYDKAVMTYDSYTDNSTFIDDCAADESGANGVITITGMPELPDSLANNAVLLTLEFNYIGGTTSLTWDNTPDTWCEYSTGLYPDFVPYCDNPDGTYYINGSVTASPSAPAQSTHTPSQTQIIWNWTAGSGATGYKWNTTNDYGTASDLGNVLTNTETSLTCNTAHTRYIWSYNASGCHSSATTLSQTTSACGK